MFDAPGLGSVLEHGGALVVEAMVDSWRAGQHLGRVPVAGGSVTWSVRREVPGTLDLVVPRWAPRPEDPDGAPVDWRPTRRTRTTAPLGRYGQTLTVAVQVTDVVSGQVWSRPLGTFLVVRWEAPGGVVTVTGESMTRLVVDDRLTSPTAPRPGGTLASEMRRLVPARLGVHVDDELVDRPCPPGMTWGESRIDAVREIVTAWPGRLREGPDGDIRALPPLPEVPVPVVTMWDGEPAAVPPVGALATVVEATTPVDSRDGAYNVIVARGQETSEAGIPHFQAVVEQTTGPYAVEDYEPVVRFWSSPLITSLGMAQASARTMLADSIRQPSVIPVTAASDYRLEVDDAVLVLAEGDAHLGWVAGVQWPLTADGGQMRVDVECP